MNVKTEKSCKLEDFYGKDKFRIDGIFEWFDIKKVKPPKNIRVLACDNFGFIFIEETDDRHNNYVGRQSWRESWEYGNGTTIVAWAYLPIFPKNLCRKDADGLMP